MFLYIVLGLMILTTFIAQFTGIKNLVVVNSGAFPLIVYIISPNLWYLSLALLVVAYIVEVIKNRKKKEQRLTI